MTATASGQRITLYKRNDYGNGQRLAARYGELIRYVGTTDCWHVWDGHRWRVDDTGAIERFAHETALAMLREAAAMPDDTDEQCESKKDAAKWAVRSANSGALANMARECRVLEGVAARFDDFDSATHELNCPNGIVNLRTGRLSNPDPAAMHSQTTACAYRPDAPAPLWTAFLELVLPDKAVRRYVQRLLGASLVGAPLPAATFPFVYGEGGTGKSTLLEPIVVVLGDYGRLAPANLLVASRIGKDQTYDIAALRGKRFVLASEGSGGQRLADDVVKRITADSHLAGRQIREAELTFPNVTALWFMSNHEPQIDGTDTGLRRRIKEIPMDVVLGPDHAGLKERMIAEEQEGILAWLVAGCVASQSGLRPPKAVEAATQALFDEANPLLLWLSAETVASPESCLTGAELLESYADWCDSARPRRRNTYASANRAWAKALTGAGLERVRHGNGFAYKGRGLRQPGV